MTKYLYCIITGLFVCSLGYSQNNQNQTPLKSIEHKEIKADKHLEKELQQKQLSAKPEQLTQQNAVDKEEVKKKSQKVKSRQKAAKKKSIKKS